MATLRVQLQGFGIWQRQMQAVKAAVRAQVTAQLERTAEVLLATAQERYVPVRFGELRDSGRVEPVQASRRGTIVIELGFYADYALATHENPRAGKTGGVSPSGRPYRFYATTGGWKYLETPLYQETTNFVVLLADAMQRGLP